MTLNEAIRWRSSVSRMISTPLISTPSISVSNSSTAPSSPRHSPM